MVSGEGIITARVGLWLGEILKAVLMLPNATSPVLHKIYIRTPKARGELFF